MALLLRTCDDHVDGELDPPVGARGCYGDVVPGALLREQLE